MRSLKAGLAVLWLAGAAFGHTAEKGWLGGEPEFLPVDEAFVLSAELDGDGALVARWAIAAGYYLYRHRFSFHPGEDDAAVLGEADIPAGKAKVDEYFGEVEVYYDRARARVPVQTEGGAATVAVGYQGCADAGLCYPPQTRWVAVDPSAGTVDFLDRDKR